MITQRFQGNRCKLDIVNFAWRVTWNYAYSPFKAVYSFKGTVIIIIIIITIKILLKEGYSSRKLCFKYQCLLLSQLIGFPPNNHVLCTHTHWIIGSLLVKRWEKLDIKMHSSQILLILMKIKFLPLRRNKLGDLKFYPGFGFIIFHLLFNISFVVCGYSWVMQGPMTTMRILYIGMESLFLGNSIPVSVGVGLSMVRAGPSILDLNCPVSKMFMAMQILVLLSYFIGWAFFMLIIFSWNSL